VRAAALLVTGLLLAGCTSDADSPRSAPTPEPDATPPASSTPSPSATPTPTRPPPHPVSLPAYFDRDYTGGRLRLRELRRGATYTEYYATYRSGGLTISGQLLRPNGNGPFPAVVYAHGYIDPDIYVNGQGLSREQDYMAARGYVVLHVDYRGHAGSSPSNDLTQAARLGYTEDVIGAVLALKKQPYVDPDRVALLGRSMGGGVVYNAVVAQPGLVRAAVVFAPVSSHAIDNFNRWIRRDPSRSSLAREMVRRFGDPETDPGFWRRLSARTYFDRITEPILIHHGTNDESCPIRWSHETVRALRRAGKDVRLHVYDGEQHAFGPQWPLSMERTVRFLNQNM
jgi:dipeptidyl aminopeptidase/acylaminoacyl peptidase